MLEIVRALPSSSGVVVAGGGALFTLFGVGGEQAKDGTEVAQYFPGLEAVAFRIVHLHRGGTKDG